MKALNKVQLIGNIGEDIALNTTKNGTPFVRFSLATNEDYLNKDTGELISNTGWHTVTAWNKTAELMGKYTSKGNRLYIEGKLVHTSWEDEKGEKKYKTEVRITEFMNLTKKDVA